MPRPRASVVIPSYNHAAYVEAAVRSVVDAPAGDALELVVVDDGSTDDSLARLESFRGDGRVRVLTQQNRGAHAALNRGIAASRGEIVFILNSDDLFARERIPRFLEHFDREPELTLLASWLEVIDGGGARLGVKEGFRNMPPWPRPCPGPGLADTGDLVLALLESNYVATTSNVAFRRAAFDGRGTRFQPLRYAHDWDFLLAVCAHGGFRLIEEPLVSYRIHTANTIREGGEETRGRGLMRFEILWVVARHAVEICRGRCAAGHDPEDLRRRLWNSLPRFGYPSMLAQLLAMRGSDETPPATYDDLLDPGHPWRRAAIETLGAEEE